MVSTYGETSTIDDTLEIIDEGIQQNLTHLTPSEICAMHENGTLTADQAYRALELMGAHSWITRIELRDRQESQQEAALDDEYEL